MPTSYHSSVRGEKHLQVFPESTGVLFFLFFGFQLCTTILITPTSYHSSIRGEKHLQVFPESTRVVIYHSFRVAKGFHQGVYLKNFLFQGPVWGLKKKKTPNKFKNIKQKEGNVLFNDGDKEMFYLMMEIRKCFI